MHIVEAAWDGTYTPECAKRIKLPSLAGVWINDYVQILEEPYVDPHYGLVALANAYHALCFIKLSIKVQEAPNH